MRLRCGSGSAYTPRISSPGEVSGVFQAVTLSAVDVRKEHRSARSDRNRKGSRAAPGSNVATLMAARATARTREMALRMVCIQMQDRSCCKKRDRCSIALKPPDKLSPELSPGFECSPTATLRSAPTVLCRTPVLKRSLDMGTKTGFTRIQGILPAMNR